MRCKNCDYPLWQIRDRTCPECGVPFRPSDYEFTLNAVKYCCPHCEQEYYGTGPKGELVPRMFECVRCAKTIDMDEMVLLPAEGVREEQTEGHRQPWLEWGTRRRFWSAWTAAIGHALVMPGRLMKATPPESPASKATSFFAITQLAVSIVSVVPFMFLMIIPMSMGPGGGGGMSQVLDAMLGMGIFFGVMAIGWFVSLLLTAGVAHGILLVTGGCAHGFKRTYQALCYSSGANAVTAVPCLGAYFGWIWWLVSACIAVKEGQRVHGGRATFAVLAFPVLSLVLAIGGYALLIYTVVSRAGAIGAVTTTAPVAVSQSRAAQVATAISQFSGPVKHVAELMNRGSAINAYTFMDYTDRSGGGFNTRMSSVPFGHTDLSAYMFSNPAEQRRQEKIAIEMMDQKTLAYRLGDTVFTHCGIDCSKITTGSDAEQLWLVIAWPESWGNSPAPAQVIVVGTADGATTSYPPASFDAELATQNALRAKYGLEALPNPGDVTHDAPALGKAQPLMSSTPDDSSPNPPPPRMDP